jgi:DNA-binding NarL/FixJ family response regulator
MTSPAETILPGKTDVWLARRARGAVPPFAPAVAKRMPVAERLEEVPELRMRGWSRDRIAKRLRISARDVSELLSRINEEANSIATECD